MEWLAGVGLIIMISSMVPQIVRIYQLKSAKDISRWTYGQLLLVNVMFIGYYMSLEHWTALALNVLLGIAMAWVLILTFIYR